MSGAAYLMYGKGVPSSMRFDVVLSETHTSSAAVTEHPVERGPNVTDHVRKQLDSITLEVFVSNTPINTGNLLKFGKRGEFSKLKLDIPTYKAPLAPTPGALYGAAGDAIGSAVDSVFGGPKVDGVVALQFQQPFNSTSEIYTELRRLQEEAEIVKVITANWDYDTMVLENVTMTRTPGEGDGARFSLELRQIVQVDTKRTAEPVPTMPRAKKPKKKGTKGAEPPEQGTSNAYAILEAAKAFVKPPAVP